MAQRVVFRGAPQFDEDGAAQGGQRLWEKRALGCWVVSGARPLWSQRRAAGLPAGLLRAGSVVLQEDLAHV